MKQITRTGPYIDAATGRLVEVSRIEYPDGLIVLASRYVEAWRGTWIGPKDHSVHIPEGLFSLSEEMQGQCSRAPHE